jgi:hypothetical protein
MFYVKLPIGAAQTDYGLCGAVPRKRRVDLDLSGLTVASVTVDKVLSRFHREGAHEPVVRPGGALPRGRLSTVRVRYHGVPRPIEAAPSRFTVGRSRLPDGVPVVDAYTDGARHWRDICLNECLAQYDTSSRPRAEAEDGVDLDAIYRAQIERYGSDSDFRAGKLYDMGPGHEFTAVCDKGPLVRHALRRLIGESDFRAALRGWHAAQAIGPHGADGSR